MATTNTACGGQDERDIDGPPITTTTQHLEGEWAPIQNPRQVSGRTLRRSCDRCHQQKLRCVGSKTSLEACARCQRFGVECVYNPRSSKQTNKNKAGSQNVAQNEPMTPVINQQPPSNYGAFDPDQLHLDSFFPSAWDAITTPPLTGHTLAAHSHSSSASMLSTSTGPVFSTKSGMDEHVVLSPPEVCKSGNSDSSDKLASICQTLENLLKTVTSEQTGQGEQYSVGEIFNAFECFIWIVAVDRRPRALSQDPNTSFDNHIDGKQAFKAAQCYMLCIRLLAALSEKMLQNLLASPTPAQRPTFGLGTPDSTQFSSGPLGDMVENFRMEDLFAAPTESYEQAAESAANMLRVGTRLIGKMEQLLDIPSDLAVGTMPSAGEQPGIDHQRRKRSLPARLVVTTWDHETSVGNKCAVTNFRRYRAAILGLIQGHV
ncbi:hypothetical protein PFICI_07936 [Pestalotiopsis fici W106-1]|uniref:Zn(2)-C6 fungal-type domain-containing protein n=1 Tax=Pestalotiopsis fici (strain W106-1 / CGMCC3.15140) TaxID=1229662 RepID=W3X4T7_PESFW|nr:uncharacterized protein PFICI_07936 [Pestalotiopsis fici W106-1]ETS80407.1 hypothetical protein PFICI_07936 [Pestalotiopsis fici W106-1]